METPRITARRDDTQSCLPLVEQILAPLGASIDPDRLVPALKQGPMLLERITGQRPHRSTLWRWINSGQEGHRLQVVVGLRGELLTSARMIATHLATVSQAKSAQRGESAAKPIRRRRRTRATQGGAA